MKVIDLSHSITQGMPVYPGTEPPKISVPCTVEKDGFTEKKLTIYSHTGTHVDAPAHLINNARTLDAMPIEKFIGKACVLNFTKFKKSIIEVEDLVPFQYKIEGVEFVLLNTGWSKFWGQDAYFENFPVLSTEAANWIANYKLKGIGLDMISADNTDAEILSIHKILLSNEFIIIENLTNLEMLHDIIFTFCCTPLKIENADGSPIRAIALID